LVTKEYDPKSSRIERIKKNKQKVRKESKRRSVGSAKQTVFGPNALFPIGSKLVSTSLSLSQAPRDPTF